MGVILCNGVVRFLRKIERISGTKRLRAGQAFPEAEGAGEVLLEELDGRVPVAAEKDGPAVTVMAMDGGDKSG